MKVMMLVVTGVAGAHSVGPWRRIVSVEDEVEFLGMMRAVAMKEIVDALNAAPVPGLMNDDVQAELLKALRLKLIDTGLTEYPDTEQGQAELYKRMTQGDEVLEGE
jgi:hypothetical protein